MPNTPGLIIYANILVKGLIQENKNQVNQHKS